MILSSLTIIYRQLLLIWKACGIFIHDAIEEGRGVHIASFGTFTFEPIVTSNGNERNVSGSRVSLRPCFIPARQLNENLGPASRKDQLENHIQGSIYQQGIRVSYLNPVPVAQGVYYRTDFVKGALLILFKGVLDLVSRGFNLDLEFEKVAQIRIINKSLTVRFSSALGDRIKMIEGAYPLKNINSSLSALTPETVDGNISRVNAIRKSTTKSRLSTLERPDSSLLKDVKERIEKLAESSRDLCNIHVH